MNDGIALVLACPHCSCQWWYCSLTVLDCSYCSLLLLCVDCSCLILVLFLHCSVTALVMPLNRPYCACCSYSMVELLLEVIRYNSVACRVVSCRVAFCFVSFYSCRVVEEQLKRNTGAVHEQYKVGTAHEQLRSST